VVKHQNRNCLRWRAALQRGLTPVLFLRRLSRVIRWPGRVIGRAAEYFATGLFNLLMLFFPEVIVLVEV